MSVPKTGFAITLSHKARAHAAALSHGAPAKRVPLIVVTGYDGSHETVAYLAAILRSANKKVGVITPQYIEIANERVEGSPQAGVVSDVFRLQALLGQMRRGGCNYVLLELAAGVPPHGFVGAPLHMVVVRRCGDTRLDTVSATSQREVLRHLLGRKPHLVVMNRDDMCFKDITGMPAGELTMTYGTHQKAESRLSDVRLHPKGTAVNLVIDHQNHISLTTTLPGKQNCYSAAAAATAGYLLHVPVEAIERGVATPIAAPCALQYLALQRPYHIVLDSALTPDGIAGMLETVRHFTTNRIIAVLAGVTGQLAHWRPVIGEVVAAGADRVVVTDGDWAPHESAQTVREQFMQGVLVAGSEAKTDEIPDRHQALEKALSIARRGDTIVVCSVPLGPYRQRGTAHHPWNDQKIIEELL